MIKPISTYQTSGTPSCSAIGRSTNSHVFDTSVDKEGYRFASGLLHTLQVQKSTTLLGLQNSDCGGPIILDSIVYNSL